jgi:phytoene dehydrogenase-like protein
MPEISAFILLMALAWFHGRQVGYPIGGSLPFVRAMEKGFVELGGTIDCRAQVAEISVENDRAVGVHLADGREERCDVVISAADGHATIFDRVSVALDGPFKVDSQTIERLNFHIHRYSAWARLLLHGGPVGGHGGGLPSGSATGRQVVQLMCHKDGRPFQVPAS